jgi:hypothetical protein
MSSVLYVPNPFHCIAFQAVTSRVRALQMCLPVLSCLTSGDGVEAECCHIIGALPRPARSPARAPPATSPGGGRRCHSSVCRGRSEVPRCVQSLLEARRTSLIRPCRTARSSRRRLEIDCGSSTGDWHISGVNRANGPLLRGQGLHAAPLGARDRPPQRAGATSSAAAPPAGCVDRHREIGHP